MKQRILVIEDDQEMAQLIATILREDGFEALIAQRGSAGLRLAEEEQPSLIVLDVNLPDRSGLEVCQQLRQRVKTASVPVIILTAQSQRTAKLASFEYGADDYITKPFDIEEFILRVRTQLRHAEQWRLSELTGLPGNRQIERAVYALLSQRHLKWAILYCDLDHFKSYNDVYGFVAGNDLITATAELLASTVRRLGRTPGLDFVGHIGGDDFVVITSAASAEPLARELVCRFDELAPGFYPDDVRQRGYIIARNRQDVEQHFPLVTMSVGIVTNLYRDITSIEEVGSLAAEVKKKAKAQPRSAYWIDRRGSVSPTIAWRTRATDSKASHFRAASDGEVPPAASETVRPAGGATFHGLAPGEPRTSPRGAGQRGALAAIEAAYVETAKSLANAAEPDAHVERVSRIAVELGRELGLSEAELRGLELGAILHDVGKIRIDPRVLEKPGSLTPEEFAAVQRHPVTGCELLGTSPYLAVVRECVYHHHERYDGHGYPEGLTGEDITLFARIVGLADAYDAMLSDRAYRPRLRPEEACAQIRAESGTHWDPHLVDIFTRIHDRLAAVASAR